MSWPIASVRGDGRDQSRTSPFKRLATSLSWDRAKLVRPQGLTKREAAKHVESFGVGFWIRVQFPAPPPSIHSIVEATVETSREDPDTAQSYATSSRQTELDTKYPSWLETGQAA